MNLRRLEERVMKDEGFRARPYEDTVGVPTVGYGTTRLIGGPVKLDGPAISAEDARRLLRADLFAAIIDAEELFPRMSEMEPVRAEVLVNMAYNLGRNRLAGFKNLIAAAERLDYQDMALAMIDSKWYRQVGTRSQRLVAAMRTGDWRA